MKLPGVLRVAAGLILSIVPVPAESGGATFGDVVQIGGQAADIALDEGRGVLYIANFTAGRIDVMSLADESIQTSIHVAPGPASLGLSPNGRYLAVAHFGNVQTPGSPTNALTLLDRSAGTSQTLALNAPPLGVAFGADGMALLATTTQFLRLDPATGRLDLIDTVAGVIANTIPAVPGTPPVQIVAAAMAASGDGWSIFGLTDSIRFLYDVREKRVSVIGYTASPPMGPRVVSVARDGSSYVAGWGVFDRTGFLQAQFANPTGALAVGSHALDSGAGLLYSQIPDSTAAAGSPPVLYIADAGNLTVLDRLRLPENLTGRGLLSSTGDTMYAVSESGVLVLHVGELSQYHRLQFDREDLVFRGNFCQRGTITQTLYVSDPGGNGTAFAFSTNLPGVTIVPASGRTPAAVQVRIDPSVFQDQRGTVSGLLAASSTEAVNLPAAVRLLVGNQQPDQRGTPIDVPGQLSDLLADPARDRFYVVRQDRNQVLVFNGSDLSLAATLRTSNTPTRLAITADRKYLVIGHDNSQLAYVYDLDTLQPMPPIVFPPGHYPRSVAASGAAILAASRVAGTAHTIDRIDWNAQTATTLTSLGVFQNSINVDTVLVPSPNGGAIMAAEADGNVLLYQAASDTFTVSRKLAAPLSGTYAASDSGAFFAGNLLLNGSLVPSPTWDSSAAASGFAFVDGLGVRLSGTATPGGTIERVDLGSGDRIRPTRVAEQPLAPGTSSAFVRSLAPLANRNTLIALSVSGFTALSWDFDSAVSPPVIQRVGNAADLSSQVAPGSLVTVFGTNLSPTNLATREIPLPTAIGQSCLTVNGTAIPMLFVSPGQINAQLPLHLSGRVPMTLYTPGGISDDYYLNLQLAAPAIFLSGTAGPLTGIPVVVKASNQQLVTPSNPVHGGDDLVIYAAGLGATSPLIEAGNPAPASPPALVTIAPDVRLGGVPLAVSYAGLAPGMIGVYQINVRAPDHVAGGDDVPLTIAQAGASASVSVRVVN